jgi:Ca-activated chloride channel homolog
MKGLAIAAVSALVPVALAQTTLRVDVRMVEVSVRVEESNGRPVGNLTSEDFEVFEDGWPQKVEVFEAQQSSITVALLIDTTASMERALPRVKNAVSGFLTVLRPNDALGLFSFAQRLRVLEDFTTDRSRTLRSLLSTRAEGGTALFDSMAQLSNALSDVVGKKAILLFTDGDDNQSILSLENSVRQVVEIGVPVYAMLYGRALTDRDVSDRLAEVARLTGGLAFRVTDVDELPAMFDRIGQELRDGYLLAYRSDNPEDSEFRRISVTVPNRPALRLRAREGYWR